MSDVSANGIESTPIIDARFATVGEVRSAHLKLLRLAATSERLDPVLKRVENADMEKADAGSTPDAETIRFFLEEARRAGRTIERESDRRAVQRILDYWSAELVTRSGISKQDINPVRLEPFDRGASESPESIAGEADRDDTSADTPKPAGDLTPDEEIERIRIRVAAQARQWRTTEYTGYLLRGDALKEAIGLPQGPDIADFIEVSVKAETNSLKLRGRRKNWLIAAFAMLTAALALATLFAWFQAVNANHARDVALQARVAAERDRTAAIEARQTADLEAQRNRELATELQAALTQQAELTRKVQTQLDEREVLLREGTAFVRRLRSNRTITDEDIPEALVPLVTAQDQIRVPPIGAAELQQWMNGYDPKFLQISASRVQGASAPEIPAPRPVGASLASAYGGGRSIDYVNFSVVLDGARRMALFSAVNLERSGIVPIVRAPERFGVDPRVTQDAQLTSRELAGGTSVFLAEAGEIAWGPAFMGDPILAGEIAGYVATRAPNVVPLNDDRTLSMWGELGRYAREDFTRGSDRVVVFSGPIFSPDDPEGRGTRIPQHLWKVMAAADPANPARLTVEAYIVPPLERDAALGPFDPTKHRVRLSDIEQLAGLDFGDVLRASDTAAATSIRLPSHTLPAAADYAALLDSAAGPDVERRMAATQRLLDVVRDPSVPEANLRALVEDLVARTRGVDDLRPEARVNLLTVLKEIPRAQWNRDRWIDLKAAARRAVADATATLGCGATPSQACNLLGAIKPNLDWAMADVGQVYLQFAGMVREDVQALARQLELLGWQIHGEERTPNAATYNEVRFTTDEQQPAAELLAADIRALGRSSVQAQRVTFLNLPSLEIWLSI